MDLRTIQFYDTNAAEVGQRYTDVASIAARYFPVAFTSGARVLDVGSGAGRDLHALIQAGYDAVGVDGSESMLKEANRRYPDISAKLSCDTLPYLSKITNGAYDGVLSWAVLMHLPEEFLFDTVFNLRRVLKKGGRLLISTPIKRPAIDPASHRDEFGRFFNQVTPENFRFLLEKVGFRLLNRWDTEDSLGRPDYHWATQLFVLEEHGSRSLDKVEGILNRDKKDATYKPALFRALAELATTSYHVATWLPEGRVSIPLKLIADKWLEYYWPLFDSKMFIPQKRGEKPGSLKPVAFRAELEKLIALYRSMGGLCGFSVAYRGDNLPPQAAKLHQLLQRRLCDTIKDGPVYFSGGGGSRTFVYDKLAKCVLMDADLWRELSMMGNWIADATILRWAELTAQISQGALKPSQVIDQLLTTPIPEREVQTARSLYENLPDKVCVWTDRSLRDQFEVDHAIPFVLWRNNDLWNLLPALPTINNHKRDRLPTVHLLRARKDCIVHYWTLMRERQSTRFDFEVGRLAGPGVIRAGNWENRLFATVAEAVEFTAIQRGIDRWEPTGIRLAHSPPGSAQVPEAIVRRVRTSVDAEPKIMINPPPDERFVRCVPFYDLAAAAGDFGPEQVAVDPHEHCTWIRVQNYRLTNNMFAIRVQGRSMEPKVSDGSICLFRGGDALAGSRQGRIVLVLLRDSIDPETGGRLTVKRYFSKKVFKEDAEFKQSRITLKPINPEYEPIELGQAEEGVLTVVGELVGVIMQPSVSDTLH
jgi:SAM-dependent methyltransferase/phage repressor protein C with HTH and peptisase S24 domain